jgi:cell division protein FtsB
MTPRNTKQGASASARKAPVPRRAREASSARPTTTAARPAPKPRADKPARPKRDASWFRWWLLPIFVVAAVALFVVTYYPVARVQYLETRHRAQLQSELAMLNERNTKLGTQVARLKTPEGVEDYARSQLGMVKQGEHVVVVTDGQGRLSTATATLSEQPDLSASGDTTTGPRGPWSAFLDAVFKIQ